MEAAARGASRQMSLEPRISEELGSRWVVPQSSRDLDGVGNTHTCAHRSLSLAPPSASCLSSQFSDGRCGAQGSLSPSWSRSEPEAPPLSQAGALSSPHLVCDIHALPCAAHLGDALEAPITSPQDEPLRSLLLFFFSRHGLQSPYCPGQLVWVHFRSGAASSAGLPSWAWTWTPCPPVDTDHPPGRRLCVGSGRPGGGSCEAARPRLVQGLHGPRGEAPPTPTPGSSVSFVNLLTPPLPRGAGRPAPPPPHPRFHT